MYRTTKNKVVRVASVSAVLTLGSLATGIGMAGASGQHSHSSENHSSQSDRQNCVRGLVTAVTSGSITIQGKAGTSPVTFTISSTLTTVTKGGAAATLADLATGEFVSIVVSSTSATTAASIAIVPAEANPDGIVTAASATSVTFTDDETGLPVTFTISSTLTTVTKGGAAATIADLAVGQKIKVVASTTSATTAASIAIFATTVHGTCASGVVTVVSGSSITVLGKDGTSTTYSIDGSTKVMEERSAATTANLAVGERVRITPSPSSATTAGTIEIDLANVSGTVVSVAGSTIVVSTHDGFNQTIVVSPTTTYTQAGASSSLSAVVPGSKIFAEGLIESNHTTLDAVTVGIGQAGGFGHSESSNANFGFGQMGSNAQFGFGQKGSNSNFGFGSQGSRGGEHGHGGSRH